MNKTQLVDAIAQGSGLSKASSKKALEATIAAVTKALKKDDKIALVGFGTFAVVKRAAHNGVNPATGKAIKIKAKKVVKFKPSSTLI